MCSWLCEWSRAGFAWFGCVRGSVRVLRGCVHLGRLGDFLYELFCVDSICVDSVSVDSVCLDSISVDSVCVDYICVDSVCVDSVCVKHRSDCSVPQSVSHISAQPVRLCAEIVRATKPEPNMHNHIAQPKEAIRLEWHTQTALLVTRNSAWRNLFMVV